MGSSWLEVLDRCAERAGLPFDPVAVARASARAGQKTDGDVPEAWLEEVGPPAEAAGFQARPARGTVAQAAALAEPHLPVLARGDDGAAWALFGKVGGRKVLVAGPGGEHRLTVAELARRLGGAGGHGRRTWALLQPLCPCEEAAAPDHDAAHPGHGHGGHGPTHHPGPVRRLMGLLRPEMRDIRVVGLYAVAVGLLSLAVPLAVEALVGTVAMNQLAQQLVVIALVLLTCLGMASALRWMQTVVVEIIQRRLFVRMASDLAYRLPRVRVQAFDRGSGPELVNRFFDILTVQKVVSLILLDGIAIVIQAAFGLAVLTAYSPYLVGFNVMVLAALSFLVFVLGRGAVDTSIQESRAKYSVAGCLEEMARTPVAYKVDGGAAFALTRTDGLVRRYLDARRAHFRVLMRQVGFALGFQALATAGMLALGGWLVIQESISLGQLVAAELIVATVIGSFAKLDKHLEGWYDLMAAVDKLGHLVDLPLERTGGERPAPAERGARLTLRGVSYGYDGAHGPVLRDVGLEVQPAELVALIGHGGSGKSTLIDLIFGLREPTGGAIEIDGVDVRTLDLMALRSQVAVVKGLDVIEGTVLENVSLGRPDVALDQVLWALEAVGLSEEVGHLPDGLQTHLAPMGAPLSLGQARRLMLARALAGRPRLLVIDELLDGLDLDLQAQVLDTILDPRAIWTVLVVTHAAGVASRCDRAVALVDGRIEPVPVSELGQGLDLAAWLKGVRS